MEFRAERRRLRPVRFSVNVLNLMDEKQMASSPDKHYQARILERRDISPDLWIVRIDPGGPFEFRAGQYATLGVARDGKRLERAYSIVSSPYEDGLEFFVELVPHGGHLGYLSRHPWQGDRRWLDARLTAWLSSLLGGGQGTDGIY